VFQHETTTMKRSSQHILCATVKLIIFFKITISNEFVAILTDNKRGNNVPNRFLVLSEK
jgi:hypothetical protein